MSNSKKYRYPSKYDDIVARGAVFFCSAKGFYCGRAKRIQSTLCPDCPAELEEK